MSRNTFPSETGQFDLDDNKKVKKANKTTEMISFLKFWYTTECDSS